MNAQNRIFFSFLTIAMVTALSACSSGGSGGEVDAMVTEINKIEEQAKKIAETKGDKGTEDFAGTYIISLQNPVGNKTHSHRRSESIDYSAKTAPIEITCKVSTEGVLECTSKNGSGKGYVKTGGQFGLQGGKDLLAQDQVSDAFKSGLKSVYYITGNLSSGSGSYESGAHSEAQGQKAAVKLKASLIIKKKGTSNVDLTGANSTGDNPIASAQIAVNFSNETENISGSRIFHNVQTQLNDDGDVTGIAAIGLDEEQFILSLDDNGSCSIYQDMNNVASDRIYPARISDCDYEASVDQVTQAQIIEFDTQGPLEISGTVTVPAE